MVVVETSFPRGGTIKAQKDESNILFGVRQKKSKPPKKPAKDREGHKDKNDKVETVSAELLSHKIIQEGMIIMGRIKSVDSTYMKISLPGRILGKVLASSVSQSYTNAISKYVEGSEDNDTFKTLHEMFNIGQIVYTKVLEINSSEQDKLNITLSLKPADVHENINHMNLSKGMLLNGAVQEIQEHGYVMESGIKNLRCFIPIEKNSQKCGIGELIFMKIDKLTQSASASTAICKDIQKHSRKIKDIAEPKLDYILPTTIMNFTVTKILKDGLQGTIMNGAFTAYVNEHHFEAPLSVPSDYNVNSTYNARLLYVMPLTKLVYLSLNLRDSQEDEILFKKGDIIDDAVVHHFGTGGIVFKLKDDMKGLLSFKSIKAKYIGNYDQDEVLTKYKISSKHKLRIIEYDPIDSLYICSDNPRVLNEQFYTVSDLKPGDFVTARVIEKQKSGNYLLSVGNVNGLIEDMFLASNSGNLKENVKMRCRVMVVNEERRILHLTNRPEYMDKNAPILVDLSKAKFDKVFTGTVVKCYEKYFLIKFFNDIKGVLYRNQLNKFAFDESLSFYEGQTTNFRIVSKNDDGKLKVGLVESKFKTGYIYHATITNIVQNGLEITLDDEANVKGLVPVRLLSDFPDLVPLHLKTFSLYDTLNVSCINKNVFSVRDTEHFKENPIKRWKEIRNGDILRAYIKNVHEDVIEFLIPIKNFKKTVKVHLKMFVNYCSSNCNIVVVPDQVVYVKVLSKESKNKILTITAKMTDIWDGDLKTTSAWTAKYLQELETIQTTLAKQNIPIALYSLGEKISGTLGDMDVDTKEWDVELSNGVRGIIKNFFTIKDKSLKKGKNVECVVIWIDYLTGTVYLSQNKNDINRISSDKKIPARYKNTTGAKARILHICNDVIICSIKKGQNPLIIVPTRVHYNDFSRSVTTGIKEGEFCRLSFIHDEYPIAIFDNLKKLWNEIENMKRKQEDESVLAVKRAKLMEGRNKIEPKFTIRRNYESLIQNMNNNKELRSNLFFTDTKGRGHKRKAKDQTVGNSKKLKTKVDIKCEEESVSEEEYKPVDLINKELNSTDCVIKEEETENEDISIIKSNQPILPGATGFWSTNNELDSTITTIKEESSDEDDEYEVKHKKKKKLTSAERFQAAREEEARLRQIEDSYVKGEVQTADQFDRLVLANPNNSMTWINYMVFHLQATELDKARNVARKALKSINFREEEELLNVWVALLNLELRYGTNESFNEVFKESLLCNDSYKIYTRCLEILAEAKKEQEVTDMVIKLTKKFRENPETWKHAASAYFKVGLHEKGQQLLHKALKALPEKEHVNTTVIFANLNHKYEDKETSYSLLENIVTSYPKRVDVWSLYVDMLIKDNLIDSARNTLDRAISQKIPLKKMRTLFKKYLEFEEKFGNEENVQKVKELASDYVKNAIESQPSTL